MKLDGDEIHVWLAFDGDAQDLELHEYCAMLEPAEEARCERFTTEPLRRQCLVTRVLQRSMLAEYAGAAPRDLRFVAGANGKPSLAPEFAALNLHFNMAHTKGLVALAVGRHPCLGVDVENITVRTRPVDIAKRFFSASEARDLVALPEHAQPSRFYAIWTLKESWIKATGLGVAAGLGNIAFEFGDADRAGGVSMVGDDPRHWAFWQSRPSPQHALALALRRDRVDDRGAGLPRVQMWRWLPGSASSPEPLPTARMLGDGRASGQEEGAQT